MATLHTYNFDLKTESGRTLYQQFRAKMQHDGRDEWTHDTHYNGKPQCVESGNEPLELQHLFSDQWIGISERFFDWYSHVSFNSDDGAGYYLELTDAESNARKFTLKCGYCGQHYAAPAHKPAHSTHLVCPNSGLCTQCMGSEHLTLDDVRKGAVRLYPLSAQDSLNLGGWVPVTDGDFDAYKPLYDAAQKAARLARIEKARTRERERMERKYLDAKGEYQGKLWLWNKGYELTNVLFYSHKGAGKFCFGWRTPLTADEEMFLLDDVLVDAPFDFELKVDGGSR